MSVPDADFRRSCTCREVVRVANPEHDQFEFARPFSYYGHVANRAKFISEGASQSIAQVCIVSSNVNGNAKRVACAR